MNRFGLVVVVGGTGLLGRDVVRVLTDAGVVTRAFGSDMPIDDAAAVRTALAGADCVVNAAAWTNMSTAADDEAGAFRVNALGAENVARVAAEVGAVVVHISTDAVFDGVQERPYREGDEPNPQSAYGRSKLNGEQRVARTAPRHHIVRVTGLYGEPHPGKPLSEERSERVRQYAELRAGLALKRDSVRNVQPTWTRPLARTIVEIASTEHWGTWHASCVGSTTWFAFTSAMKEALESASLVTATHTKDELRPKNAILANHRVAEFGLRPMPCWEDALRDYLVEMTGREPESVPVASRK